MRYVEHGSEPIFSDPLNGWPMYSIVGIEIPLPSERSARRKRRERLEEIEADTMEIIKLIVKSGILN